MRRITGLALLLTLVACGGGDTTGQGTTSPSASATSSPSASVSPAGTCSPTGEVEVEAEDNSFSPVCLAARAGAAFTIKFKNRDEGTSHNVVIKKDQDATQIIFRGKTSVGKEDVNYNVPAIPKGVYFFHCDFHRGLMEGTFIAA